MTKLRTYCLSFVLLVLFTQSKAKKVLYIGGIFDIDTSRGGFNSAAVVPAVEMALDDVRTKNILKDYELKLLSDDAMVGKDTIL